MSLDVKEISKHRFLMSIVVILVSLNLIVFLTLSSVDIYLAYVYSGAISVVIALGGLVLSVYFGKIKSQKLTKKAVNLINRFAVLDIEPLGPILAFKPVPLRFKIRNPLNTYGVRLRIRSYDYFNPSKLDLLLEPGEESYVDVVYIPTASGRREFSVTVAQLYGEDGEFIPDDLADDLYFQEFEVEVEEAIAGGLSSRERSILSGLIKFATFLSASGLIYFSILRISGLEALIFVLTQIVPVIAVLQVPALMLMFYLEKRLPEKPTFEFREVE